MIQVIRRFFGPQFATTAGTLRRSPARKLMEAAQTRAPHDAKEAQDLRRAAIAQLSVVR